jgi:hypothetical protein
MDYLYFYFIYNMVSSTMMRRLGPLCCPKLEELSRTSGDRRRLANIGNPARRYEVDPHIQTGGYLLAGFTFVDQLPGVICLVSRRR